MVMTKLQSIRSCGCTSLALQVRLLRKSEMAFSSTSNARLLVFCTCGERICTRAFKSCAWATQTTPMKKTRAIPNRLTISFRIMPKDMDNELKFLGRAQSRHPIDFFTHVCLHGTVHQFHTQLLMLFTVPKIMKFLGVGLEIEQFAF